MNGGESLPTAALGNLEARQSPRTLDVLSESRASIVHLLLLRIFEADLETGGSESC